jgi:hypothetical protein
MSNGSARHLQQ